MTLERTPLGEDMSVRALCVNIDYGKAVHGGGNLAWLLKSASQKGTIFFFFKCFYKVQFCKFI